MLSDRSLIYAATFLRALATGFIGVLLGLYLARLSFGPGQIGVVLSAGLSGATLAVVFATFGADRFGRRRTLTALAALIALGGLGLLWFREFAPLALVAFMGMLNGHGRDRGAQLVIEQAILPATATDAGRTRVFAWYNVLQDTGHGLGALLAAVPEALVTSLGVDRMLAYQCALGAYATLFMLQAWLSARLSTHCENPHPTARPALQPESRARLTRISALFALDSLAGGFLGSALLAYFFHARFGASDTAIALLFVGARILNAVSHLGAAWLAQRIGLVNTMVFTHIPSSILLMTVPIAPDFTVAALLFLLREGLVEMDVPTRQSYVMAMVLPEERTFASGVTHLVRLGGWALGPAIAGPLMQFVSLGAALVAGAGMKIAYDLLLWRSFRTIKPPEEVH